MRKIHSDFGDDSFAHQNDIGFARDGISRLPGQDLVLGRFVQQDAHGVGVGVDFSRSLQDFVRRPVLLRGESLQRMLNRRRLCRQQ